VTHGEYILYLCAAGGLLSIALGIGMQRIRPNRFYGIRTPATYADRRVWRDANRQAGKGLIALGVGVALFSLILTLVPGDRWPLGLAALFLGTLGWTIASVSYAAQRQAYYQRIDTGLAAEDIANEGRR
jgi:uncharacterized membrane protein